MWTEFDHHRLESCVRDCKNFGGCLCKLMTKCLNCFEVTEESCYVVVSIPADG